MKGEKTASIEGRLSFTDTHVHFWDRGVRKLRYDWLEAGVVHPVAGDYEAIKSSRYNPVDFEGETRFSGVSRLVHVQAAVGTTDPRLEVEWLKEQCALIALPVVLVAYADLTDRRLADVLEQHVLSGNVCGIRDLRYDDYFRDPEWQRGFRQLSSYSLMICDDPALEQVADAAQLVGSCPEIVYCVDHAGFPRRRDEEYFLRWREAMGTLARLENTIVKVSGLGMGDHRWTVSSIRDWVLTCIDLWGIDRVVFGSNWPCDRVYSSYADVWQGYAQVLSEFSSRERVALFSGNADRVFRCPESCG